MAPDANADLRLAKHDGDVLLVLTNEEQESTVVLPPLTAMSIARGLIDIAVELLMEEDRASSN